MPNPQEVATLNVAGIDFKDWESVWIQDRWTEAYPLFRFTCAEREPIPNLWTKLQFKPGDNCQIILAGQPAIADGLILERQVAYDANSHLVQLSGVGRTFSATRSSVLHATNNFDNKDFVTIATEVLAPFGISPKIIGTPSGTIFKELQCQPGENVWDFLERLARVRQIILGSDGDGNFLIIGKHGPTVVGDLVEGINIEKMQCILSVKEAYDIYRFLGAKASHDEEHGHETKSQSADAFGEKRKKWFSIIITPAEQPTKQEELKERAEAEKQWREYTDINATIVVQGWVRPGRAEIWKAGTEVKVISPMAMLNTVLKIKTVTYTQDSASGTLTTLECVNPRLLNSSGVDVGAGSTPLAGQGESKATQSTFWTSAADLANVWQDV